MQTHRLECGGEDSEGDGVWPVAAIEKGETDEHRMVRDLAILLPENDPVLPASCEVSWCYWRPASLDHGRCRQKYQILHGESSILVDDRSVRARDSRASRLRLVNCRTWVRLRWRHSNLRTPDDRIRLCIPGPLAMRIECKRDGSSGQGKGIVLEKQGSEVGPNWEARSAY